MGLPQLINEQNPGESCSSDMDLLSPLLHSQCNAILEAVRQSQEATILRDQQ